DRDRGLDACVRGPDTHQAVVGGDLDHHHEQVRLVAPTCPRWVKVAFERKVDHAAVDAFDLQLRVTAASSRADSSTDSSTGTNGSSYSMLIVPRKPDWTRRAVNWPHHSRSWPRPTVAKFQGISSG